MKMDVEEDIYDDENSEEQENTNVIKRIILQIRRPRGKQGIDLTKTEYDWLPDARNQRTEYTARTYVLKDGLWVYPGEPRRITFTLYDVSKEKGVCMNYPMDANTNPDIFFADDDERMRDFNFSEDDTSGSPCPTQILDAEDNPEHAHHYLKATTQQAVTEATVIVRCEDYGAFGWLKAEASGSEPIPPREKNSDVGEGIGPNDIRIPLDEDGNNIADCTPQDGWGASPDSDDDSIPNGDGASGDGLTNYEEYRGFIVADSLTPTHIRTDIDKKDLFILDKAGYGLGMIDASELTTHLIASPEYYNGDSTDKMNDLPDSGTQVINYNRGNATGGEQHALRLVDEVIPGYGGYCCGKGPGTPGTCNRVTVNVADATSPYADPNALDCCIAHEIGHAINLWHHGQNTSHDHDGHKSDPAHGTTSGDMECIMRYYKYTFWWCYGDENDQSTHIYHTFGTQEHAGTTFCTDPKGTYMNDWPGEFNNHAAEGKGACKYQIKVKDW
jgi:archaellin